jgi:hypothetical protein
MREWSDPNNPKWKSWACGHARRSPQERPPTLKCPPCAASDRHSRRYIAGHIALLLLQFVLMGLFASEALR